MAHAYCNDKFDGFYEDPNDCQAFFQCLKGTATKRYCLKGMVFNAMLKTCDTPNNFPCRLAEDTAAASLQTDKAAANPDHRQEGKHDRKPSLANSTISGKRNLVTKSAQWELPPGNFHGYGKKKKKRIFHHSSCWFTKSPSGSTNASDCQTQRNHVLRFQCVYLSFE